MARVVRFVERGLARMADRVGTEKGRRNFAREYDDAMSNTRNIINLANDKRYGKQKADPRELRNIDSIARQAVSKSHALGDAKYTEQLERNKFESRTKGMKAGGKVRGAGCATKGKGKGTMR